MPTVEKTRGGQVYIRSVGQYFSIGDRADVSESEATYLVEERGDFEIVDGDVQEDVAEVNDAELTEEFIAERIDAGECPWCSDYEGENVGQHASSAHPDKWDAYKEG